MTELNEIKAKYPLAVEFIKGKEFEAARHKAIMLITTADYSIGIDVGTNEPYKEKPLAQDEIGKMLAELLNLIAKP